MAIKILLIVLIINFFIETRKRIISKVDLSIKNITILYKNLVIFSVINLILFFSCVIFNYDFIFLEININNSVLILLLLILLDFIVLQLRCNYLRVFIMYLVFSDSEAFFLPFKNKIIDFQKKLRNKIILMNTLKFLYSIILNVLIIYLFVDLTNMLFFFENLYLIYLLFLTKSVLKLLFDIYNLDFNYISVLYDKENEYIIKFKNKIILSQYGRFY